MSELTGWKNILTLFITLSLLSACSGGGGTTSSDNGNTLPTRTLSWAAPIEYTDNTPLNPTVDLDKYEIYVNESGPFTDADLKATVSAHTTSYNLANITNLSKGIPYKVSMRAVAVTGIKSVFSTSASFSF